MGCGFRAAEPLRNILDCVRTAGFSRHRVKNSLWIKHCVPSMVHLFLWVLLDWIEHLWYTISRVLLGVGFQIKR